MPWLTVRGNVALAVDQVFAGETQKRARSAASTATSRMVGLCARRRTAGRPSFRAACASASLSPARSRCNPEILLLDEPLSALDALTRAKLQDEIDRIWREDKTHRRADHQRRRRGDPARRPHHSAAARSRAPRSARNSRSISPRPRNRAIDQRGPQFQAPAPGRHRLSHGRGRRARAASTSDDARTLPNVVAITQMEKPPTAYQKAAGSVTRNLDRYLEYSQLSKIYPTPKGPLTVVDDFDLKVRKGEFVSLDRPLRLRQVHGAVDDGRSQRGFARRHHPRWPRGRRAGPDRAVVFQAPIAVSLAHRARERRARRRPRLSACQTQASATRSSTIISSALALRTRSTSWPRRCRTACASVSASRAPSRCRPSCCCWTSRSACSTA